MAVLRELLQGFFNAEDIPELEIKRLTLDSRQVQPGDLFIAYLGCEADGRDFISQAIAAEASVVLQEAYNDKQKLSWEKDVPIISVPNLPKHISEIAARFYNYPSKNMLVVGITGTNGKTSCGHLLAGSLNLLGKKTAMVGTLGSGLFGELEQASRTTPDPVKIQNIFHQFNKENVQVATIETSSHGLMQNRVSSVEIDAGIFTNLTRDHLNYHKTMQAYEEAKRLLFTMPSMRVAVFNADDDTGLKWIHEFKNNLRVCGYSLNPELKIQGVPIVTAKNAVFHSEGIQAEVITPWGRGILNSQLLGKINLANILAALSMLGMLQYDLREVLEVLPQLAKVPGRLETLGGSDKPLVVIDFAHSPDALKQALTVLRAHCEGELFCLFGCGGGRDRGIRPMLARVAESCADRIILTTDNSRMENQKQITNDILSGFSSSAKVQVEDDRLLAIKLALSQAKAGDVILIAGKGHETSQIVGEHIFEFNEKEIVKTCLEEF